MAEINWKKDFPTYGYDHQSRDVVLEEYKAAGKVVEAEERIFGSATNVAAILGAIFTSIAVGSLAKLSESITVFFNLAYSLIGILLVLILATFVILANFAERRRSIVYAERKVVVLRRMLGVYYGRIQLILPKGRIEGEEQPLYLKFFPGWLSSAAFPCLIVSALSSAVAFYALVVLWKSIGRTSATVPPAVEVTLLAVAFFVILCCSYRFLLMEENESLAVLFARKMARVLRVKLVDDMEYVIYRSRLSVVETARVNVDSGRISKILVFLEDKQFHLHNGLSLQGSVRAAASMAGVTRSSGGSTLSQQLVRSLFIVDQTKKYRRKIVEAILALAFDRIIDKSEQLDMYLSSVRYDHKVYGVVAAQVHFFGTPISSMSPAQCFFLIERISNVRRKILVHKILYMLAQCKSANLLTASDVDEIRDIYEVCIERDLITATENERQSLRYSVLPLAKITGRKRAFARQVLNNVLSKLLRLRLLV